jgi:type II secretory pathway pseudopilin PulG
MEPRTTLAIGAPANSRRPSIGAARRRDATFVFLKNSARFNQAFTLLEIGLVLFIIVVLAGISVPFASGLIGEQRLRGSVRDLQLLARTARGLAVSENRPYEIKMLPDGFSLEPYLSDEKEALKNTTLGAGVEYQILRWGEKELRKPEEEPWIFQPTGLCEPVRFRFQRGGGWIEFVFNPLTASAQDETNFFP